MTKIPNVDWEGFGPIAKHPTTTRQDNMRAVQLQLGGSAAGALGASAEPKNFGPTQGTPAPPFYNYPSGINDGQLSCGLSQVNPMPPGAYLQPDAELAKLAAESFKHPERTTWKPDAGIAGINQHGTRIAAKASMRTILSPDAVKRLSALVDNGMTYQEAMLALQCRFLEGDTEFIDEPNYSYVYGHGVIAS